MIEIEEFLGFTYEKRCDYLEKIKFSSKSPARSCETAIRNLEIAKSTRWGMVSWIGSWFRIWYDINSPIPGDTNVDPIVYSPMKKINILGSKLSAGRISLRIEDSDIELVSDNKLKIWVPLEIPEGPTILDKLKIIRNKRISYNKTILPILKAQENKAIKQSIEDFLMIPLGKPVLPAYVVSDALSDYVRICEGENIILPKEYIYYLILARVPSCTPKPIRSALIDIAYKEHYRSGGKISMKALELVEAAISSYCTNVSFRIKSAEGILMKRIKDLRTHYAREYGVCAEDFDIKINGKDVM